MAAPPPKYSPTSTSEPAHRLPKRSVEGDLYRLQDYVKRGDTTRVWQLTLVLIFPLKLQTPLSYLRSQGVTVKLLTRGSIYIDFLQFYMAFICKERVLVSVRVQKTKGTEIELIPATRGRNLQNQKYLNTQIPLQGTKTIVWKKLNFPKIVSKEILV